MQPLRFPICTGFLALTGAALATVGMESTAAAAGMVDDPPPVVFLEGVVRDLRETHSDFERRPDNGYGHYVGNVEPFIGPGRKPVFSGGGKKVTSQFRDSAGRPIAPHLFNAQYIPPMTGEAPNQTSVILKDSNGNDAYKIEWLSTFFNSDGTSTWSYRVSELPGGRDLSHWNLALSEEHQVVAGTTPGYDLGIDGSTGFYGIKWDVPNSFTSGVFVIVLDNHYYGADLKCSVLAKGGREPDVGDLFAPTNLVSNIGSPFVTEHMLIEYNYGDQPGSFGASDTGGVQDGSSFRQWYFDEPGTNMSKSLTIQLDRQPDGTYVFDSSTHPDYQDRGGFYPIDNELFDASSPPGTRNCHFTYEIHAKFTYDRSADQFVRFIGNDDTWVFIDGKLAIDLGGVRDASEQYVDLERLGLEDGETYTFDFFHADRHCGTGSHFLIETNLVLDSVTIPTVSAAFD